MPKKKKGKKRNHKEISKTSPSVPSKSKNSSKNEDYDHQTTSSAGIPNEETFSGQNENNSSSENIDIEERYPPTEQPISHRKANISQFSSWDQAFQAAASIIPHDLGKDFDNPHPSSTSLESDVKDEATLGSGNVLGVSQIANEYMMIKRGKDTVVENVDKITNIDNDNAGGLNKDEHEKSSPSPLSPPKKKKKKKKDSKKEKKKKKEKSGNSSSAEVEKEDDIIRDEEHKNDHDDSDHLEGKMITHQGQSIMVLVDKTKKIVYSATERSEDGNLVQIGILGSDFGIQIPNKDDGIEKNTDNEKDFPFEVDEDDHCESPFEAYQDLCPILEELVRLQGKNAKDKLAIYDPYYCNGSVIQNLNKLGFTNIYNRKEDCYKTWSNDDNSSSTSRCEQQPYPQYDVFITNPPYSNDHIEKLISHLTSDERTKGKPWCLLMPTFVHKKEFYKDKIATKSKDKKKREERNPIGRQIEPFYLVPKKRYVYLPPKHFREKKLSDVHKKSSPFVSIWYVYGGTKEKTDRLVEAYNRWLKRTNCNKCDLARGRSALRDLRRKKK